MPCPFLLTITLASLREKVLSRIRVISRNDAKARSSESNSHNDRRQSLSAQTVALEHSIVRNDSQFLHAGLGDEHSVEWITVQRRQTADC